MSASLRTRKMSDRHEEHLVATLGGRLVRASGASWIEKTDGKHDRDEQHYAFAWDGKSTLGKSIGITLEMIAKIREQAGLHLPAIPLRWYAGERLVDVHEDWIAVPLEDFALLLEDANAYRSGKDA